MPAHHKRVRVPFSTVANGYGGAREIKYAGPGLWQIISATTPANLAPHPEPNGMIWLIVAPARGGK